MASSLADTLGGAPSAGYLDGLKRLFHRELFPVLLACAIFPAMIFVAFALQKGREKI
jgi:hypothetical protein